MSARVPESRIDLQQDEVRVSKSVRSLDWVAATRLHNWISGRSVIQVPSHAPMVSIASSASSEFPYRVLPRYQDTRYRYSIILTAETETTAEVLIDGASQGTFPVENRRNAAPLVFDIELGVQSTTEAETVIKVTAGDSSVTVEAVLVEALPRVLLAEDANDLGANRMKFWIREAISERNFANSLLDLQNNLRQSARRCGCFAHSWGTDSPKVTTNGSYENKFEDTISILGRFLFSGETQRTLSWRVKAYNSDGSTAGNVRVSNDAGTSVIAVPAGTTTATWFPTTGNAADTFLVDAEDNETANGLRGGTTDDHTFEAQRTAGAGNVLIETISVWEA